MGDGFGWLMGGLVGIVAVCCAALVAVGWLAVDDERTCLEWEYTGHSTMICQHIGQAPHATTICNAVPQKRCVKRIEVDGG